jgi:hypothetical protein
MDQRVGVHAFHRCGNTPQGPAVHPEEPPRLQNEKAAQALATAQCGIAHGLEQPPLGTGHRRQHGIEGSLDELGGLRKRRLKQT